MSLEQQLSSWTGPSSDSEKEKQERTERMVREAINGHAPFEECALRVYAKGSYANNTNVRSDSDVDIAVECTNATYWEEASKGLHTPRGIYAGPWTPRKLREELTAALVAKFGSEVDTSGSTALRVHSNTARIDADIVPCFSYEYYFAEEECRAGTKIFKKDQSEVVNYPAQQLANGAAKNRRTGYKYKKVVRILKRVGNSVAETASHDALPSYFIECLAYNCPDRLYNEPTWTETVRAVLLYVWNQLEGEEPTDPDNRWREVNECFYLFHPEQSWARVDGRQFAQAVWNYLGLR
ncbi:nucleotidyltransferase domain-containing protein [Lentisalinibacter orientalis]|uniref:nucleotidyltransferase domain-containing protein n=1 Tax=Lentisalinibacter orientalis TaxID=2992241 RepID=UPI00386BFF58